MDSSLRIINSTHSAGCLTEREPSRSLQKKVEQGLRGRKVSTGLKIRLRLDSRGQHRRPRRHVGCPAARLHCSPGCSMYSRQVAQKAALKECLAVSPPRVAASLNEPSTVRGTESGCTVCPAPSWRSTNPHRLDRASRQLQKRADGCPGSATFRGDASSRSDTPLVCPQGIRDRTRTHTRSR